MEDGTSREFMLFDHALELWRAQGGSSGALPPGFITAAELSPHAHLAMQAALQPFVDNSISKTINIPLNCPFEAFKQVYDEAYDMGLKGCTTFRPNPITGAVVSEGMAGDEAPHCCALEREAD